METRQYCRKILDNLADINYYRGRALDLVIIGALYLSSKNCNDALFLHEAIEILDLDYQLNKIQNESRNIAMKLGISVENFHHKPYIDRVYVNLKLPDSELTQMIKDNIADVYEDAMKTNNLSGRNPIVILAAVFYVALKPQEQEYRRRQREIADIMGVTEVALRYTLRALGVDKHGARRRNSIPRRTQEKVVHVQGNIEDSTMQPWSSTKGTATMQTTSHK